MYPFVISRVYFFSLGIQETKLRYVHSRKRMKPYLALLQDILDNGVAKSDRTRNPIKLLVTHPVFRVAGAVFGPSLDGGSE